MQVLDPAVPPVPTVPPVARCPVGGARWGREELDGGTVGAVSATRIPQPSTDVEAQRGFNRSIVVSGVRCLLTYVILPFVAPLIGLAPGVGPVVGLIVGTVAIAANVFSIRRFWQADHRWKRQVTVLHVGVIILLLVLLYLDLGQLAA